MAEFSADIVGFTKREADHFSSIPAKTLGGIIVRPPIEAKVLFNSAVLGREAYGVELDEVITTSENTVFIAQASRGTEKEQKADITTIANRIIQLATAPESIIEMIDDNPFPAPKERW